jgi:hypothetical protein
MNSGVSTVKMSTRVAAWTYGFFCFFIVQITGIPHTLADLNCKMLESGQSIPHGACGKYFDLKTLR